MAQVRIALQPALIENAGFLCEPFDVFYWVRDVLIIEDVMILVVPSTIKIKFYFAQEVVWDRPVGYLKVAPERTLYLKYRVD